MCKSFGFGSLRPWETMRHKSQQLAPLRMCTPVVNVSSDGKRESRAGGMKHLPGIQRFAATRGAHGRVSKAPVSTPRN